MSFRAQDLRALMSFFSQKSASGNIISLALTQTNDTVNSTFNISDNESVVFSTANPNSNQTSPIIPRISSEMPIWLIPCYSIILLFAIVGNLLVISTLVQNRRMRTITNVFLLNLAISDMLLGVLCMPVTLVGTLLRHFIFGEFLCKLIQFSQAASVAVSSWTLVAISCERYYAICHPLRSRTWQTINHAYKIIGFIWFGSIVCMTPIAVFSQLIPTSRQGLRKCRENWPRDAIGYERSYNILLDLILLVLPLLILCVAYILITRTLYVGMKNERAMIFGSSSNKVSTQVEAVATVTTSPMPSFGFNLNMSFRCHSRNGGNGAVGTTVGGNNANNNAEVEMVYQQQPQTQRQQHQQHQQQQHQQQQCYDDITQQGSKRKLLTASDGRRYLYCMRSSSVKSVNRNNNGGNTINGSSVGGISPSPSMTVINVPQQQRFKLHSQRQQHHLQCDVDRRKSNSTPSLRITQEAALRRSNETKNLESKKRVVKMLFVLVLEFFICWTPLYVINTVAMFIGPAIYEYVDYTSISFFHLLAYSSSCCNPITYCFMNAGFRRAFLDTFKGMHFNHGRFWRKRPKNDTNLSVAGNSIALANSGATVISTTTMLDSPRL
ncbi:cholecystokinin receptor-like [Teleopsis dalmanni]|uniref:cholecystokinin receptor-like n=1 Tax=Teleopsis dalmanni TaxID=139649 RepID=UPI0018CFB974|nr:cholecystokinin receptor-like [Teleopsis dalmanni]